MNYEKYPVIANTENNRFEFQSIGKRGVFTKVVFITPLHLNVFNLSLVDYEDATHEYSDISITDNGDMNQVIATVIGLIGMFLNLNPGKSLYFEGSTASRTRLYQIIISKIYDPSSSELVVEGYKNGTWHYFEPNKNYDSFLIKKR
ncbi:DUF6934 family protein [Dyadobacter aurulentus]|uniref:DUF6934 family protein n=1 Tax=Dyadobacter sp. UC 10 TaxID=2605428 RepID=UPI0011F135C5|nr:hypothetical protein [Dyadobacter sp. UC 10]KAA0989776.1 hypothetical protein FXO21_06160 [Dyadobacter sp. UC 10]